MYIYNICIVTPKKIEVGNVVLLVMKDFSIFLRWAIDTSSINPIIMGVIPT